MNTYSISLPLLSDKMRKGEVSVRELTQRYLQRILEDGTNAVVAVHPNAPNAAEELQVGERDGRLFGIPFMVKDNFSTQGLATTCASPVLRGYEPPFTATAVERLVRQGGILLGKTNMDEFGMGSQTTFSVCGATRNPHDAAYSAGGSSGGSAAAVAAGLCAFALGSDTGGSVRLPASHCGVFGFKPSYGVISRSGLIAYASSLDCVGLLTSSASDASYLMGILSGADEKDDTCIQKNWNFEQKTSLKGKRIGVLRQAIDASCPAVSDAVRRAILCMCEHGAIAEEVTVSTLSVALSAYYVIACAEASSNLARYDGVRYGNKGREFGSEVKRRILAGTYVLSDGFGADTYQKAVAVRQKASEEWDALTRAYDAIALPVAPTPAQKLTEETEKNEYVTDLFTVPASLCSLPALSLPVGKDADGLPVGLQLVGGKYKDDELLALACAFEREVGVC